MRPVRAATAPGRPSGTAARPASPLNGSGTKRSAVSAGAAQVAARHLHPAQVQLAGHAGGRRLAGRVQEVGAAVGHRPADGDVRARDVRRGAQPGDVHGGLGGAVDVVQLRVRQQLRRAPRQGGRERLAAAHHAGDGGAPLDPRLLQKEAEHGGDEVQRGDALAADRLDQVRGIAVPARARDHHPRARQQRREELARRGVEAHRRLLQHHVVRGRAATPRPSTP